jgi:hypothetical protein
MVAFVFEDKGDPNMPKNLKAVGAADDLPLERRVQILQQKLAELLTVLQEAGIKTEL